jgi:hypothetical protein
VFATESRSWQWVQQRAACCCPSSPPVCTVAIETAPACAGSMAVGRGTGSRDGERPSGEVKLLIGPQVMLCCGQQASQHGMPCLT